MIKVRNSIKNFAPIMHVTCIFDRILVKFTSTWPLAIESWWINCLHTHIFFVHFCHFSPPNSIKCCLFAPFFEMHFLFSHCEHLFFQRLYFLFGTVISTWFWRSRAKSHLDSLICDTSFAHVMIDVFVSYTCVLVFYYVTQ